MDVPMFLLVPVAVRLVSITAETTQPSSHHKAVTNGGVRPLSE